jgi:hypothetical protein
MNDSHDGISLRLGTPFVIEFSVQRGVGGRAREGREGKEVNEKEYRYMYVLNVIRADAGMSR